MNEEEKIIQRKIEWMRTIVLIETFLLFISSIIGFRLGYFSCENRMFIPEDPIKSEPQIIKIRDSIQESRHCPKFDFFEAINQMEK